MTKTSSGIIAGAILLSSSNAMAHEPEKLRIATFNVSMEAFNYLGGRQQKPTGKELEQALKSHHPQIKNIAEIIQKINPDIILLNEFDRNGDDLSALKLFLNNYVAKSQNSHAPVNYPYYFQGPVNTGVVSDVDFSNNGKPAEIPADTYGFGLFPGHFAMAVLSKYPIDQKAIRTFQHFKWKDMPGALRTTNPEDGSDYYNDDAWQAFRLPSKSLWDIPVNIGHKTLHVLASHPTPPVFDGPEDRNGKRNHDEIRLLNDYISTGKQSYIYDDSKQFGGLGENKRFVVLGDLNASNVDGDAINEGINQLLTNQRLRDPMPKSKGGAAHSIENPNGQHHTAYWRMRADYVLPSIYGMNLIDSGVFWPSKDSKEYRLIKDRAASSDHRLVWIDVELK